MERTIFADHYRIELTADGTPVPLSRSGAAMNYKATDTRTGEPVMLQLVSRAAIDRNSAEQVEERARAAQKIDHVNVARVLDVISDDDYIGLVSEYNEGETVESWLVAHGPMPADAVLRIGLQVVRAVAAGAFFGLTHRAIQPSNLIIVSGQTLEGAWPFVKVLNFGLAGLETHTDGAEAREVSSSAAPQFASPEQLLNKPIDFRSEMYSLGATLCFLLTGAVPLAVGGMKARLRARRLPELRRAPRALRNLLVHMLRENPENRPQDPVAFEAEICDCLGKVERRQALGRKLGLPLATVRPGRVARQRSVEATPARQVGWGILAFAALLLLGGIAAAFLLPEDVLPFKRRSAETIGVPVGVPSPAAASVAANQPSTGPAPVVAGNAQPSPGNSAALPVAQQPSASPVAVAQAQPGSAPAAPSTNVQPDTTSAFTGAVASWSPNEAHTQPEQSVAPSPPASAVAANSRPLDHEAPPPAEGPNDGDKRTTPDQSVESSSTDQNRVADSSAAQADEDKPRQDSDEAETAARHAKKRTGSSISHRTSGSASNSVAGSRSSRARPSEVHARFVGTTSDGRMIMRLPSGRTVVITPGQPDQDVDGTRPRRRVIERREILVPYQPFDPGYPHD